MSTMAGISPAKFIRRVSNKLPWRRYRARRDMGLNCVLGHEKNNFSVKTILFIFDPANSDLLVLRNRDWYLRFLTLVFCLLSTKFCSTSGAYKVSGTVVLVKSPD